MILRYFTRLYVISQESCHTAYAVATRLAKLVAAIPGDEISIVAAFSVDLVTVASLWKNSSPPALQPSLHNLHSPKMSQTSEMLRESLRCFHLNSNSDSIHLIHARFHLEAIATDRLAFRPDHTRRVKHPFLQQIFCLRLRRWSQGPTKAFKARFELTVGGTAILRTKWTKSPAYTKRVRKEMIVESGYV